MSMGMGASCHHLHIGTKPRTGSHSSTEMDSGMGRKPRRRALPRTHLAAMLFSGSKDISSTLVLLTIVS